MNSQCAHQARPGDTCLQPQLLRGCGRRITWAQALETSLGNAVRTCPQKRINTSDKVVYCVTRQLTLSIRPEEVRLAHLYTNVRAALFTTATTKTKLNRKHKYVPRVNRLPVVIHTVDSAAQRSSGTWTLKGRLPRVTGNHRLHSSTHTRQPGRPGRAGAWEGGATCMLLTWVKIHRTAPKGEKTVLLC